ncbi:MAG: hypothetical protein P8J32_04500 [bacterium]|nr:hypothetical protein [bacterium]
MQLIQVKATTMIEKIKGNIMGTKSIIAKFPKMRKSQSFIVYPISSGSDAKTIKIQSDTRMGQINTETGEVLLTKPYPNGAYFHHLQIGQTQTFNLSDVDLQSLRMEIFASANSEAGKEENGVIQSDNSGAINILG